MHAEPFDFSVKHTPEGYMINELPMKSSIYYQMEVYSDKIVDFKASPFQE